MKYRSLAPGSEETAEQQAISVGQFRSLRRSWVSRGCGLAQSPYLDWQEELAFGPVAQLVRAGDS